MMILKNNNISFFCKDCKHRYNEYKLLPCIECIYNPITHKKDCFATKNKN